MAMDRIGQRLKEVREKDLRLKTKELAEALQEIGVDTSDASVSRYENGIRVAPADYLWGISELSGVSVDWIMRGDEAPRRRARPGADPHQVGRRELAREVLEVIRGDLEEATAGGGDEAEAVRQLRAEGAEEALRRYRTRREAGE